MQLLDVKTAASRLAVHPETMRDYLRSGVVKGIKMGATWKIEETEIAAYIERLKAAQTN
jgi:excisionase family DNA binding protein